MKEIKKQLLTEEQIEKVNGAAIFQIKNDSENMAKILAKMGW